jgi:hypothetical protein
LAILSGCGGSASVRVSNHEQSALPTKQFALGENVCAHEWDSSLTPSEVHRRTAVGQQQLATLEAAYRADPSALVKTTYASSDEGPGSEDITVRALLRTHLAGATEPGLTKGRCLHRLAKRLRTLLHQ